MIQKLCKKEKEKEKKRKVGGTKMDNSRELTYNFYIITILTFVRC